MAGFPTLAAVGEAEQFDVTTVPLDAGRSVVRVRGELDLATCPRLEAALDELPPGEKVVLDLGECSFLDSSAIRVLLNGATRAESAGGALALVATGSVVLRALEIASIGERIPIHPTVEAAAAGTPA
jgi:anti-sigma B factor antagonist